MRKVLVVLFLGFVFLASASYSAYGEMQGCQRRNEGMMTRRAIIPRRMGMPGAGLRMIMAFKGLGLNEQQKDSIRKIGFGLMKEAVRKRADIKVARIELREVLQKDHVDMSAVESKLKQIASLQTDLRLSFIRAREEIKSKLTPGQRLKFRKNMRRWMLMQTGRCGCMAGNMGKMVFRDGDAGIGQPGFAR